MPEVKSPTLEDATDDQLEEEYQARDLGEPEKDTGDFSDEEIQYEYSHRFGKFPEEDLSAIYEEFRKRGDAPECLRAFLYQNLGRILP